jgi:hypothetical protein
MAIALLGLNVGVCAIPYLNTLLWDYWLGPSSLFELVLTITILVLPLPLISAAVSYRDECKPWILWQSPQWKYQRLSVQEEDASQPRYGTMQ